MVSGKRILKAQRAIKLQREFDPKSNHSPLWADDFSE